MYNSRKKTNDNDEYNFTCKRLQSKGVIKMKIKRNCLYALLCIVFIFLGFGGGYLSGKAVKSEKIPEKRYNENVIQNHPPAPTQNTEPATAELSTSIYYLLISENNLLNLYEVSDTDKVIVKTISFKPDFLPEEDKQRLSTGIRLDSKEDGYELIEDFTS